MSEGNDNGLSSSNIGVGIGKLDGDRLDIDDLREISVSEYDREYGETKITGKSTEEDIFDPEAAQKTKRPKPKPGQQLRADASSDDEGSGDAESSGEEEVDPEAIADDEHESDKGEEGDAGDDEPDDSDDTDE